MDKKVISNFLQFIYTHLFVCKDDTYRLTSDNGTQFEQWENNTWEY